MGKECSSAWQLPSWGLLNRSRPRSRLPLFHFIYMFQLWANNSSGNEDCLLCITSSAASSSAYYQFIRDLHNIVAEVALLMHTMLELGYACTPITLLAMAPPPIAAVSTMLCLAVASSALFSPAPVMHFRWGSHVSQIWLGPLHSTSVFYFLLTSLMSRSPYESAVVFPACLLAWPALLTPPTTPRPAPI